MSAPLPRITVVTPSYNQAEFLGTTIQSVLGQQYPNLEYMVMDGGSSDGSAEIIQRHASHLAYWVSEKDGGQSAALNRAFARATGDIFCWINSDDYLLPGSLWTMARELASECAKPAFRQGHCLLFRDRANEAWPVFAEKCDPERLSRVDCIVQPASFWTSELWRRTGPLDESLHFTFDWDWFVRAQKQCEFQPVPIFIAGYRLHGGHKTGAGGEKRTAELRATVARYGTPEAQRQFEWLLANPSAWAPLRRWEKIATALRRNGVSEKWASLFAPELWPKGTQLNKAWLCDWLQTL